MSDLTDEIFNSELLKCPAYAEYNISGMYSGEYILTLKPIIKYVKSKLVLRCYASDDIDLYINKRIKKIYHNALGRNIKLIMDHPAHEQRTPEWFKFRENLITGSEAGYFLGVCGNNSAINAFRGKIGLPNNTPNGECDAIQHGVNYECVAKSIYELRNQVTIAELGCIKSDVNYIGASPDGIVCKYNVKNCNSMIKYGRLLEIKCPYTRIINGNIKPEYDIQIAQQQFTCRLPICDFMECGIIDGMHSRGIPNVTPYNTLDDLLEDKYIGTVSSNKYIPQCNLSRLGMEKGILILKKTSITEQILYPINTPYNKHDIALWLEQQTRDKYNARYVIKYWKVYKISIITKIYNKLQYESYYMPKLNIIWGNILLYRSLDMKERYMQSIVRGDEIMQPLTPKLAPLEYDNDPQHELNEPIGPIGPVDLDEILRHFDIS